MNIDKKFGIIEGVALHPDFAREIETSLVKLKEENARLREENEKVRKALWKYHNALDRRQNGHTAAHSLVDEVEEVFGHWQRGATLEK